MDLLQDIKPILDHLLGHEPNPRLLIAVSGGLDSMALLHLCHRLQLRIGVAHCNFQLRGEDSEQDALLVKNTCTAYHIPHHHMVFQTQEYAQKQGISIEMAARDLRYHWFSELLEEHHYDYVVTAHHQNDQVETLLMNLSRGSGIDGLVGMRQKRASILRPLLGIPRKVLEAYVLQEQINYREDRSNQVSIYLRNQYRNLILPQLEQINPAFITNAHQSMEYLKEAQQFIEGQTARLKTQVCKEQEGNLWIDIPRLQQEIGSKFLLYELIKPYGFKGDILQQIYGALASSSGKQFISNSHRIYKYKHYLVVHEITASDPLETYEITADTKHLHTPIELIINRAKASSFELAPQASIATIDYDQLVFPLKLRHWKQGDTFQPLGMKGSKKLSDYFIDNKWSLSAKEEAWILESAGEIVWLIGHRLDDRFKITPNTKTIYTLTLKT